MTKGRIEAFSDGVIAVMVLQSKPRGHDGADVRPKLPIFLW